MDNNEDLAKSIAKSIVSVVSSNEGTFRKALSITNAVDDVELTASIISSVLRFASRRVPSGEKKRFSAEADSSILKEFSSSDGAEFSDDENECLDSSGVFSGNPSVASHGFSQDSDCDDFIPNYLQMQAAPSFPFGDEIGMNPPPQNEEQRDFSQDSDFYSQELQMNRAHPQQNAEFSQDSDIGSHDVQQVQPNGRLPHPIAEFSQDSDFYSQELQMNRAQTQQNAEFSQDSDIGLHEVQQVQQNRTQLQPIAEFSQDSDFESQEPQPSFVNQNAEFSQDSDYGSQSLQQEKHRNINQIAEFSQDSDGGLEQMAAKSNGPVRLMAVAGNEEFSQDSDAEPQGRLNEFRQNALVPPQMRETDCFSQQSAVAQLTTAFDEFSQDED